MGSLDELIRIFAEIDDPGTMAAFFEEIFTEKERHAFALRWQLLKELYQGETQRKIAARHKISLCKITRGSKILKNRKSVTFETLKRLLGEM